MSNLAKFFNNDLSRCEEVMDWATSDQRVYSNAWNTHAELITSNYDGQDWCWSEAIELWNPSDIEEIFLAKKEVDNQT